MACNGVGVCVNFPDGCEFYKLSLDKFMDI